MKNTWHVIIITDTGREVPHWTANTRREARKFKADSKSTLSPFVKMQIKKS